MTNLDPEIYIPFAILLGLLVGSFLNVVIYRLPVMLEKPKTIQHQHPALALPQMRQPGKTVAKYPHHQLSASARPLP